MVNMMMMMNKSQFIVNNQRWVGDRLDVFVRAVLKECSPEGVFVFHDADCRLAL